MSTLRGKEGFEKYYTELYGERWRNIIEAFVKEPNYVTWKPNSCDAYFLDSASVLAAYSLPLDGSKRILDMCAAPGGKSLVLAHRMDVDATLLCNERSAQRRTRLSHVLNNHLTDSIRSRIAISANDGALMCKKEVHLFDAILLDAPCSSERHVFLDNKYLQQWSSSRIKHLSVTQWALLSSAFRILKSGGFLLYSTCALSQIENDIVIKKLLKKFSDAKIESINFSKIEEQPDLMLPLAEKTECGYMIFPDTQNGAGPLYFSLIKKQ